MFYRRTDAGNAELKNPSSIMPRFLRSILIAVNGKTTTSTFIEHLSAFGDVATLLKSMEASGLIELSTGDTIISFPSVSNENFSNDNFKQDGGIKSPTNLAKTPENNNTLKTTSYSNFESSIQNSTSAIKSKSYDLKALISMMSDFITQHLPEQSLEIILALDSIESIDELKISLEGYRSFIQHLGPDARSHLHDLQIIIDSQPQ